MDRSAVWRFREWNVGGMPFPSHADHFGISNGQWRRIDQGANAIGPRDKPIRQGQGIPLM